MKLNKKIFWMNMLVLGLSLFLFHRTITGMSIDIALHNVFVNKISNSLNYYEGYIDNLGEMLILPPFAHIVAGLLSRITQSSVIAINIINIMILFLGWHVITKLLLDNGIRAFFIFVSLFFVYYTQPNLAIFGNEVVKNYLFSQFFATGILLYALYKLIINKNVSANFYILSLFIFALGLFIHASFSIIFFVTNCLIIFYSKFNTYSNYVSKDFIYKNIPLLVYGVLGLIIFYFHPFSDGSGLMRKHNGMLGFSGLSKGGADIAIGGYLLIAISIIISTYNLYSYRVHHEFKAINAYILVNLILLGSSLVSALMILLYWSDVISAYIVKKNFFTVVTFLLVSISITIGNLKFINKFTLFKLNFDKHYFLPLIFILTLFFKFTENDGNFKYSDYLYAKDVARFFHIHKSDDLTFRNTIIKYNELPMTMNFLISLSDLEVPRGKLLESVAHPYLLPNESFIITNKIDSKHSEDHLMGRMNLYSGFEYHKNIIVEFNKEYFLNDRHIHTYSILGKGFAAPESWGTWTSEPNATIQFDVPDGVNSDLIIKIKHAAWIEDLHPILEFSIVDETGLTLLNKLVNSNKLQYTEFVYPKEKLLGNKSITLMLNFKNSTSPWELGLSGDVRNLGLSVVSLQIEEHAKN